MDSLTQAAPATVPGYYVWDVAGKPKIHLNLDVIERLVPEIMRGFGAVPKRGAEVGGLLIGTISQEDGRSLVRIEDVVSVPCSYTRGPSYLFNVEDAHAFNEAYEQVRPDSGLPTHAIGYYRSQTRDGSSLGVEDIELMDRYFPDANHVVLLVRPFATKASAAGFLVREGGAFPASSPLEFPLGRRELTGEDPRPRRTLAERRRDAAEGIREVPRRRGHGLSESGEMTEEPLADSPETFLKEQIDYGISPVPRTRGGWAWIPLSFIFLLLGVLLGFLAALSLSQKPAPGTGSDFSLALAVTRAGNNLNVKWNRDSIPVQSATRAMLEIDDGGYSKPVDLDAANLKSGVLVYRNSSEHVRFRLVIYLNPRLTVTETAEWHK